MAEYIEDLCEGANTCSELSLNDYTDWYLPSRNELRMVYNNKAALESAGTGSFNNYFYWSSSEANTSQAYWVQLHTGDEDLTNSKTSSAYIKAIRRFKI